ncbi:hypothetical protein DPMN_058144 [Dreissena polymorpha]|uniref:Uncharacterized protein n=1 Tax=Dreissena polymorpha TaxID=45954 RepID=A0A9D4C1G5_DREPO|nr:hypothetical protein DPMN_058144 [Dreissena polymorpha]
MKSAKALPRYAYGHKSARWTDGQPDGHTKTISLRLWRMSDGRTDSRTDNAKTISLRLWRGIITKFLTLCAQMFKHSQDINGTLCFQCLLIFLVFDPTCPRLEHSKDTFGTNILIKFHEDWALAV